MEFFLTFIIQKWEGSWTFWLDNSNNTVILRMKFFCSIVVLELEKNFESLESSVHDMSLREAENQQTLSSHGQDIGGRHNTVMIILECHIFLTAIIHMYFVATLFTCMLTLSIYTPANMISQSIKLELLSRGCHKWNNSLLHWCPIQWDQNVYRISLEIPGYRCIVFSFKFMCLKSVK